MKPRITLATQITLARLGLAIVFFILLSQYRHTDADPRPWLLDVAAVLFVVAALTDILDGYVARRFGLVTALGRVLDPLVDKVLICGTFILFVGPGFIDADGQNVTKVQAWMVVVIVGRELLVTGLRGFNESTGRAFPSGVSGKVKMWMQSIAAPLILLLIARGDRWAYAAAGDGIKLVVAWVTVVVTALSMVQYLARSRHILEQ